MHGKPATAASYDADQLDACHRVLANFRRRIGPLHDAIYIIGGLAPSIREPNAFEPLGPHIGTTDIDLLIDLDVLPSEAAYSSFKENVERMGFARGHNRDGRPQHHCWERTESDEMVVSIDFLCDVTGQRAGTPVTLPGESGLSAISIPGGSLVTRDYVERHLVVYDPERDVELNEVVRVAGIAVSIVLKAFAFDQRRAGKDAYDIVWSLGNHPGGPERAGQEFAERAVAEEQWNHHANALAILHRYFGIDPRQAVRRDGPAMFAEFISGEPSGDEHLRRRQQAAIIVSRFLRAIADAQVTAT